ncbi:hypothetical protein BG011_000819 [Mortierella polycephala]|uniref:Uncharacterized protein n=1 Tax=Mortierella polycephala TaxID=41804 RepID=A0A9P6U6U1_9FUNG|nr:hypothetical protein BG011_000819 [Mortierella polycephala]
MSSLPSCTEQTQTQEQGYRQYFTFKFTRNPDRNIHRLRVALATCATVNLILVFITVQYFNFNHFFINFILALACLYSFFSPLNWKLWIRFVCSGVLFGWNVYDIHDRISSLRYSGEDDDGNPQKCPSFNGSIAFCTLQTISIAVSTIWGVLLVIEGFVTYNQRRQEAPRIELARVKLQERFKQGKQDLEQGGKQHLEQGKQYLEQGKQHLEQGGKQRLEQGKQYLEQMRKKSDHQTANV